MTAAFFINEKYMRDHSDVVSRMAEDGHVVGNHTSRHVSVMGMPLEALQKELKGVEDAYREATGRELPRYFRPPQGRFNEVVLSGIQQLGYTTAFWSFRYEDWDTARQPSENSAYATIMEETHPGEVVLLHCQSETNVKLLEKLITAWKLLGYQFGSIDHIAVKKTAGYYSWINLRA